VSAVAICAPWDADAVLRGQRVTLRPLAVEDVAELLGALEESREHVRPWLPFADRLRTAADCHEYIVRNQADWLRGDFYSFGVRDPASDRLLGATDLFLRDRSVAGRFSVGYWLRASAEGHGFMTAAVRLITRFAFGRVRAQRVEISCDARNTRSAAVARRLGFRYEGALRNLYAAPDGTLLTLQMYARIPGDDDAELGDEDR
jgi:RimJ/RimL family protein N-acetyltransferase